MFRAKIAIALAAIACTFLLNTPTAHAATSGCYGAGCNGLNPTNRCDGDARTVRAMDIGYGMLELRWSPSCQANWARFNEYGRSHTAVAVKQLTVWNPGRSSYGLAQQATWMPPFDSSHWSAMTDGTKTACVGIEVNSAAGAHNTGEPLTNWESYQHNSGAPLDYSDNTVWIWGPCY